MLVHLICAVKKLIEGIGAAMVIPSITALAAINYTGRDRAVAYALLGGVAAALREPGLC